MIDLRRFFEVIFDTPEISDDKMRSFSEDHIGRIAANNTANQYDTMLNDTEAAHTANFGAIDSEATLFALQQSRTVSANNAMDAFKKAVSQQEGAVRSKFNKDTPEYQEFFPLGLTEYQQANKSTIESLMTRILNAFTAHSADLGAVLVTQFTALRNNYLIARGEQIQKKGEVTASKSVTQTTRNVLEKQLQENLLTLAIEFMGNPDRGMDFFDQSIYRRETSGEGGENPPSDGQVFEGTVGPLVTVHIDTGAFVIEPATSIEMKNPGTVPLNYYFASAINGFPAPGAIEIIVPPAGNELRTAQAMGFSPTTPFLHVRNNSGTGTGNYRVVLK